MTEPELLLDAHATLGEAPTWHAGEQAVYWIDVREPALHRLELHSGATRRWKLDAEIGAFAVCADGSGAVVALRTGVFRLDLVSGAARLLAPPPFDPSRFRFNEGICDANGRFWIGGMLDPLPDAAPGPDRMPVHRFTLAEGLVPGPSASDLHNGFAWSADGREFFWSHSSERTVFRAAYDPGSGTIGTPQPFVRLGAGEGVPDGAAMDEENCYWCAMNGAGALHRYDRDGELVAVVRLPVSQPTMCTFAGPGLDRLVVTSAREGLSEAALGREPHAGALFVLDPGVRGVAKPYRVG
ncbi:MAG: SMP-30/gluconolactonase/LRE family protein [Gluconacetobacter diazotrophicus]|nr:SMP-30/gluconolactonase/LRE family protein [Gluconacetobacter diazotrophicus]